MPAAIVAKKYGRFVKNLITCFFVESLRKLSDPLSKPSLLFILCVVQMYKNTSEQLDKVNVFCDTRKYGIFRENLIVGF